MNQIEGDLIATDLKIAFVVSRFNEFVCERLLEGALDSHGRHGGNKDEIAVLRVPGAFELPLAAKKLAESGKYDAIVCLGAVIRGETSHYDYVCEESARGLNNLILEHGIAVGYGVLTTENREQAMARSSRDQHDRGGAAARACLAMIDLKRKLSSNSK